ncbi:MAG: fasciclin domain-containing protein [Nitratireductor sp.]
MLAGSFETFVVAVDAAGLLETLRGEGPFMVMAPSDEVFAALPAGSVKCLLERENQDLLVNIVTCHVDVGEVIMLTN